jgi:hypothetical protein
VPDPNFRLVCVPAALDGAPQGWADDMIRHGEVALLVDDGGLDAINALAHDLDIVAVRLLRTEATAAEQEQTVIAHAASLPLIWVAGEFSEQARTWARARGPMTLLVEVDGSLPEDERRRIERFVGVLGRQAE